MKKKGSDLAKGILKTVGVAGVLVIALTLPNAMMAFKPFLKNSYNRRQTRQGLKYLEKRGMVSISQEGDKAVIRLTKHGKEKLLKYNLDDLRLKKDKKWDGKWRLVAFDIPESFKLNRNEFSRKLKDIGFVTLQKSLLVYPYECEDEVDFLGEIYEVSRFVTFITAASLDKEARILKRFNIHR